MSSRVSHLMGGIVLAVLFGLSVNANPGTWTLEEFMLDCRDREAESVLQQGAPLYRISCFVELPARVVGHAQIRYVNRTGQALPQICLRLLPNALGGECVVSAVRVGGLSCEFAIETSDSSIGWIDLVNPLLPSCAIELSFDFDISIPTGDFPSTSLDSRLSCTGGVLSAAYAFPHIPAVIDGKWVTPRAPAQGEFILQEHSGYIVEFDLPSSCALASTGRAVKVVEDAQRTVTTVVAGPVNDFYWGCSPKYSRSTRQVGDIILACYAPEDLSRDADAVLYYAERAIRVFESVSLYPYTELDLAIADLSSIRAAGAEFSGAILVDLETAAGSYSRGRLGASPFDYDIYVESVVIHEVAHQWFPTVVGSNPASEPWLDESLAQLMTWMYFTELYRDFGEYGFRAELELQVGNVGETPVDIDLGTSAMSSADYAARVYSLGPLVLWEALSSLPSGTDRTIQCLSERATRWRFLADYVSQAQWQISNAEILISCLRGSVGDTAVDILSPYLGRR